MSLSCHPGEIFGLIGANGAGKTTLMNILSGIEKPTEGKIFLNDRELHAMPAWKRARYGIKRSFQHSLLRPDLSALENVLLGCVPNYSILENLFCFLSYQKEEKKYTELAKATLGKVSFKKDPYFPCHQLPFVEQRRVEMARALLMNPTVLLLDEPAAGLNSEETSSLSQTIISLKAKDRIIILVEHDVPLIMRVCDRVSVLDAGKLIACDTPEKVQKNQQVRQLYLGTDHA